MQQLGQNIESKPGTATEIHPTAIVAATAELGAGVTVGPYAVVGPHVRLGQGVKIHAHAVVDGHTTLHEGVEVYSFAAIGTKPQDLKYDGSPTELVVGARTVLREYVTAQPGSGGEGRQLTRIGEDCLIMAYCHVAHDCEVGNRVIMANCAQLAGHVRIEDFVTLGGCTTVHQFVRVGTRAFTGAQTRIQMDVPPYMLADGHPAGLFGLNTVGLKRAGFTSAQLAALKKAYRALFVEGPYTEALASLEAGDAQAHPEVDVLCRFLRKSERGVTRAGSRKRTRE